MLFFQKVLIFSLFFSIAHKNVQFLVSGCSSFFSVLKVQSYIIETIFKSATLVYVVNC